MYVDIVRLLKIELKKKILIFYSYIFNIGYLITSNKFTIK